MHSKEEILAVLNQLDNGIKGVIKGVGFIYLQD
jgi:hypothetical protein